MNWTLGVILVCLLLAVFTIWLENKRANKSRLTWRILALIVAIAALACIALPVTSPFGAHVFTDSAVLLTENYNRDSVANGNYKKVFTLDKGIKKAYPAAILLSNVQDIHADPTIKQLHVLGYGLDEASLKQLDGIQLVYTSPSAPGGVLTVNWQQQLKVGEPLKVQGRFNNTSLKPVKLILRGLNTSLDSTNVEAGKVSTFELSAVPKTTGRAAYSLLAVANKDTIENESVPVSIDPARPLKVLMLSAAPDFENKFLKDWLGQNGYSVAVKATISKGKISRDFANMEQLPLDNLSPGLLNKFDVVISDLSTLASLNSAENAALKQQVEQNGLGVIIRADTVIKTAPWLEGDFRTYPQTTKNDAIALHLQAQKNNTAPINTGLTYIAGNRDEQILAIDAQKNTIVAAGLKGQGKVVWTTIRGTYTWMLAGDTKDYSAYWSLLMNKAARNLPADGPIAMVDGIATVNEPTDIQLHNAAAAISVDEAKAAPSQNPFMSSDWDLNYWPARVGWVQANSDHSVPSWLYIYGQNEWKSIKNLKKIGDTKKYSDNREVIATIAKQTPETIRTPVPKTFFYILLLAACTFLWAERKLIA